jgi:predicted O-methyltransferase YrrM
MKEAIERTLEELEAQRASQAGQAPGGPRDRDKLMLAVGPETGQLLNTLLRATGARRVLERSQLLEVGSGLELTVRVA